ncbi:MAG: G8 domain-containing protein [Gemmataceae bacterium]
MIRTLALSLGVLVAAASSAFAGDAVIRSARSGPWSDAKTWESGKVPGAGARVDIRPGHTVTYDVASDEVIRGISVAGTLTFATDKNTRLNVGLIRIQPGKEYSEEGFECDGHLEDMPAGMKRPALLVGTPERPIQADKTALVRLHLVDGMNKESCPAIVCCGGRMDFHGAPMSRTWLRLGATAKPGATTITLAEPVTGWKAGDHIIVTASTGTHDTGGTRRPGGDQDVYTEEATIKAIDGKTITLAKALVNEHLGEGDFRAEVANLSRNVVVESADKANGKRGHTMYHRNSKGSISYAEFRHLGKENVLGRYALHFHLCGDTMRGSYVVGASIWDSHNRWLTVHGTDYLVVRDCVGYQSVGHGYYLEDGTEVFNVFDRNLAVQAFEGKRLPKQALPFDANEGAGFWWANSLNTFTRNVAVENDRYGFRFEATQSSAMKMTLPVRQPDGSKKVVDIRTLPFVRFDDNECHCDGRYGFNLGEGVNRVGPDARHPFIIRNMKIWNVHYGFRPQSPFVLIENMTLHKADYGVYHPNYDHYVFKNLKISYSNTEPFNRGHDDLSVQYGPLAVDGLTFANLRSGGYMPLIQISDDNPTGTAVSHFRNVKTENWTGDKKRALVNLGGGPRPTPKTEKGVPIYFHDWFGPGKHARIVSTRSSEFKTDGLKYRSEPLVTGDESRLAEVSDVEFPKLLDPVDDLPPTTVITHIAFKGTSMVIRGTTADNGKVRRVTVNGVAARPIEANYEQWEAEIPVAAVVEAFAEDEAGNRELRPHAVGLRP